MDRARNNNNSNRQNNKGSSNNNSNNNNKKGGKPKDDDPTLDKRWLAKHADVPMDPNDPRFVQSFTADQEEEIKEFFNFYGFVVIRDVLTAADCLNTLSEIYDIWERETNNQFQRNNVDTWSAFPPNSIERYGSVSRPPIFSQQFLKNRTNPIVYRVWSLLLNNPDLLVNHDRCCVFRPTKDVPFSDGVADAPAAWSTAWNLHLDMNPWAWLGDGTDCRQNLAALRYNPPYNNFIFENNQPSHSDGLQMQGVLNLVENTEEDGGFICVPGFQHQFDGYWSAKKPNLTNPSHNFKDNEPISHFAKRIPMHAGSMVVWDQRLPHGSAPNRSSRMRSAQFIKLFPASTVENEERRVARVLAIQTQLDNLPAPFQLTPESLQLLAFAQRQQQ